MAGYFSKFPTKIFLPSLTLNKGRRLWGCFWEQFEILSKKGFSAQISKLSGETFLLDTKENPRLCRGDTKAYGVEESKKEKVSKLE